MSVTIEEQDLLEIKSALGYPTVDVLDQGDDTDTYIKNYVVSRVLRIYFTYFPIKSETNTSINGAFSVDYPSADVYKVLRHFFNYKQISYSNISPFILQTMVASRRPSFFGFESSQIGEVMSQMSTAESLVDWTKAIRVNDEPHNRKVTGSSNTSGDLLIQWAKKSEAFNDVLYNQRERALKLCKSYLLEEAVRLRSQARITVGKIEINVDELKDQAKEWKAEVMANWVNRGQAILVKS